MLHKFKAFHDPSKQQQKVSWYSYPIIFSLGIISYCMMFIARNKMINSSLEQYFNIQSSNITYI